MATTEEIERRVEEADAARSAKRAAAAKRVGELAQLRAEVVEKLGDIERELGDVLAESSDVMGVDELAKFTDVPAADLAQWLNGRKVTRPKRKLSTASAPTAKSATSGPQITAKTTPANQASAPPELAGPPAAAADTSTRSPAAVT